MKTQSIIQTNASESMEVLPPTTPNTLEPVVDQPEWEFWFDFHRSDSSLTSLKDEETKCEADACPICKAALKDWCGTMRCWTCGWPKKSVKLLVIDEDKFDFPLTPEEEPQKNTSQIVVRENAPDKLFDKTEKEFPSSMALGLLFLASLACAAFILSLFDAKLSEFAPLLPFVAIPIHLALIFCIGGAIEKLQEMDRRWEIERQMNAAKSQVQ